MERIHIRLVKYIQTVQKIVNQIIIDIASFQSTRKFFQYKLEKFIYHSENSKIAYVERKFQQKYQ